MRKPASGEGYCPMSNGGSTQLRTTARSPSSSPMTRAEAGTASADASATSPAPTARRPHPDVPPCTVADARRARSASQPRASAANAAPWTSQGLRVADPEQDHRGQHGGQPEDRQQRGEPRPAQVEVGQRRPQQAGQQPEQPGSTSSGPSPSTGGSVVSRSFHPWIAWSTSVDSVWPPGTKAVSPTDRRHSGPAEQEEHHGEDEHRRDERPAERPAQVGHHHGDDGPEHADDEERPPGEGGRQTAEGHRRQQSTKARSTSGVAVGDQVAGPGPGLGVDVTHRRLHRSRPPRSSWAARCRTGRPPVSVTRLVPSGSSTTAKRRTSGGNAAEPRSRSVKEVSLATDQEEQAAVRRDRRGPAAGRHDAGVPEVGAAHGVERQVPVGAGRGGRSRRRRRRRTRRARRGRRSTRPPTWRPRTPRRCSTRRARRRPRGPRGCGGCRGTAGPAARTPPSRPSPWPRSASGCGAGRRRGRTRAGRGRRGRSGRPRRSRRPRGRAAARRRASRAAPSAGAPAPRAPGVHTMSREKTPTGSPRRVVAGPTRMTPRRSVRMVNDSSCTPPAGSDPMP